MIYSPSRIREPSLNSQYSGLTLALLSGSETLTLSGPKGIEKIKVVLAEDGRLVFITPESLLLSGATYTVTINGARDRDGLPLPVSGFSFSTPQAPGGAGGPAASTPAGLQVLSPQPTKTTPQAQVDAGKVEKRSSLLLTFSDE